MIILENYFDVSWVPDYCSKEKLEKYYGYYLKNLKASPFRTGWVTLDRIERHPLRDWKCIGDKYLEDSDKNHEKLAMDIYANGTYFPIFLIGQRERPYKIRDGAHRVHAMRYLVGAGLWEKDRRILVSFDETIDRAGQESLFYLPLAVVDGFKKNYSFLYQELIKNGPLVYADDDREFAEYRTVNGGYLATACLSLLLRNAFFEFKQKHGTPIAPSPVINNYMEWQKWRGY